MMSSYQETTTEPALFASMTFLSREDLFLSEKPYRLTYNSKNIPRTNVVREVVHEIPIWDLREVESTFTFEKNGIAILEHQSSMTYEDFSHPAKIVERYCTEIAQVLLEYMRADYVYVFDYNVRRRLPNYPNTADAMKTVSSTSRDQPVRNVHIDATQDSTIGLVKELHQDAAESLLQKRVIYVNVWRPLIGPLEDWPLCLCDSATINTKDDLIPADHVAREENGLEGRIVENYAVHYNQQQRWYFLSDQQPTEILVFRQSDTSGKPGVPHASFPNPLQRQPSAQHRESIEIELYQYGLRE